ncbi:subtilisin-like protein [Aulographum hederae CBS 113979]|uniref:Subtilisin-like protein n=1 Tax=Aulographum hederae CBS 113979 TaxID=1176131 RepID=A0A6G1H5V9_9PEZI|nr:subtilisin-like protein [Aulographum hederae CBS 113979]
MYRIAPFRLLTNLLLFFPFATLGLSEPAPFREKTSSPIPDKYIVTLQANHTYEAHFNFIGRNLSEPENDFTLIRGINAYACKMDPFLVHQQVRLDPGVKAVEEVGRIHRHDSIDHGESTEEFRPLDHRSEDKAIEKRWSPGIKSNMIWNARMLTAEGKLMQPIPEEAPGEYLNGSGHGVCVYVMDTGVSINHWMFQGRAVNFKDYPGSPFRYTDDPDVSDTKGHGTHVAGIVMQNAPWATIVNVKVLGENENDMAAIQAINDITDEHLFYRSDPNKIRDGWRGSVINMSFWFEFDSDALNAALKRAHEAGISMATSAGNGKNGEGTKYPTHPCWSPYVICVGASTIDYEKAKFSNYGEAINIWAPGKDVWSANGGIDGGWRLMSGTSQASPAVAGVMAIWVSYECIWAWAGLVYQILYENHLENAIDSNYRGNRSLINTGLNHPKKRWDVPYLNAPQEEIHRTKYEAQQASEIRAYSYTDIPALSTVTYSGPTNAIPTDPAPTAEMDTGYGLGAGPTVCMINTTDTGECTCACADGWTMLFSPDNTLWDCKSPSGLYGPVGCATGVERQCERC